MSSKAFLMRIDFSQYSYYKIFSSFRSRAASFSLPTVVRQRSRKCIKIAKQRRYHPSILFLPLIDVELEDLDDAGRSARRRPCTKGTLKQKKMVCAFT